MFETDLACLPASELAALVRSRRVSPVEIVDAVLARIGAVEPRINAFTTILPESARAAARAAEAKMVAGEPLGPLHGVPVTIKDLTPMAGVAMRGGSRTTEGNVPERTAPLVERLVAAGAIVVGRTTTSEFGWKGVSDSPLTGVTHNPWRHGFNAGASSAGAGAACAAGCGPLHHGSDGAGSIRMPAHFCGVFGMKPSFGRVPIVPSSNSDNVVHQGTLTRTVADAALMLCSMAGPHPEDYLSLEGAPADYTAARGGDLSGLRIAFSPDLGHARVDPAVAGLVRAAVEGLPELGAAVEEVRPAWGPLGPELIRFFWPCQYAQYSRLLPRWRDVMEPGLVACIEASSGKSIADLQIMRERKLAYIQAIGAFFKEWDFLVTPAVSTAAFPTGRLMPEGWPTHEWDWLAWAEFSYPFNFSGNPAASIPCGFTPDGLPVGLQIVGRRFDDAGVLRVASVLEAARPWAQHWPAL
ncbi:MAG TPA: amidase family protein [Acidocella sp.]|jgi:aspartyl-tRNA(Asn)/glutamyl-tRNA(Gln) amidotransferase subunit A|nr:amidase family protein [Acidocella sp.]